MAKRHHFVPQGFLRGFCTKDDSSGKKVWVYDKRAGRRPRLKSVRSIAWQTAYYAQETADGEEDIDSLEIGLAQTVDNEMPRLLKRISPAAGGVVEMCPDERGQLAFFLGLSLTRVPSFRQGINDLYTAFAERALSREAEKDSGLGAAIARFGLRAEAKEWVSLRPMIEMAELIADSALRKRFQFFLAPESVPLVTSDNPVIFSGGAAGLAQIGPAHPGAELVMNLRSDLALVCTPKTAYPDMQVFELRFAEARKFNRGIVGGAKLRVFANHYSERLDAFVKKYEGHEQRIVV